MIFFISLLVDFSVRETPVVPTRIIQQGAKRKNDFPNPKGKTKKSWPKHPVRDFLIPTNGEKTLAWEAKAKHFTGKKITSIENYFKMSRSFKSKSHISK